MEKRGLDKQVTKAKCLLQLTYFFLSSLSLYYQPAPVFVRDWLQVTGPIYYDFSYDNSLASLTLTDTYKAVKTSSYILRS